MRNVAIAIPTFRRPKGLELLLQSLAALKTDHIVTVVIGDNDPHKHEGFDLASRLRESGFRWPLHPSVIEPRGISQVRNALVDSCLKLDAVEFIIMLDDDEIAEPAWLDEMISVQAATQADIVGGRVNRQFEKPIPSWAENISLLAPKSRGGSGIVELVDSTANILFTRSCLEKAAKPLFDPGFALSGGGDKEALTRLKRAGNRFAWAEEAIVSECIPETRVTEQWVLQRAFRIGNSDMRVLMRHAKSRADILAELLKAFAVFAWAPAGWALSMTNRGRRVRMKMMVWRAAGKVATLAGVAYREYAVTHGN
jgi:succinoglycan biosynthesis protein ExoM